MLFYYNSLDEKCKSTIGGIVVDKPITFNVYTTEVKDCSLKITKDGENTVAYAMQKTNFGYSCSLKITSVGLYFYGFEFGGDFYGQGYDYTAEKNSCEKYRLTVYREDYETPERIKGGIIYQIFPDRFCRVGDVNANGRLLHERWDETPVWKFTEKGEILNNDFFGGNFKGIESKLDYLKSLGVTAIYLNPITKAYSNHRYDTGDYMKIDELLGTETDFKSLVAAAKEKNVEIILDGVFNHTGADSKYFNKYGSYADVGAYQSRSSKYYEWYNFIKYPDVYESWWGFKSLPTLNKKNEEYREFVSGENGVISHYMDFGISGYRLDVVDELPDDMVAEIRNAVKRKNKDAILIGEVWENATDKIAYGVRRKYFLGNELDSVMNYPLYNSSIDFVLNKKGLAFKRTVSDMIDNYPKPALDCLMNVTGTHDTVRLVTRLSGLTANSREEMAITRIAENEMPAVIEKVKKVLLINYTVSGVPSVYYGDELGMQGFKDPFNRQTFTGEDKYGLLEFVRRLGKIRRSIDLFKDGDLTFEYADNETVAYSRKRGDRKVYILINLAEKDVPITFDGELYELLTNEKHVDGYTLQKDGVAVLYDELITN